MAKINCQERLSFNSRDWTLETDSNGRIARVANGKGVYWRMGVLVKHLHEAQTNLSKSELAEILQDLDPSYNVNDVGQPLRQLRKIGAIETIGFGPGTTYKLTQKGRDIYKSVKVRWV